MDQFALSETWPRRAGLFDAQAALESYFSGNGSAQSINALYPFGLHGQAARYLQDSRFGRQGGTYSTLELPPCCKATSQANHRPWRR